MRVTPSTELPLEKLKTLAMESGLLYDAQADGCLLVRGENNSIKDFVKKMATKFRSKAGK
jgi:hypothetical protein